MSASTDIAESPAKSKRKAPVADRWDDVLRDLDKAELPQISEYARARRAEGMSIETFIEQTVRSLDQWLAVDGLNKVLDMAKRDRWNMPSAAIHHASDLIQAEASPEVAYQEARARYFTFDAAHAHLRECDAIYQVVISAAEVDGTEALERAQETAREDYDEAFEALISFPTHDPRHINIKKAILIARDVQLDLALELLFPPSPVPRHRPPAMPDAGEATPWATAYRDALTAHAAHDAACSRLGDMERDGFPPDDDAEYTKVREEEGEACHQAVLAWSWAMETPAATAEEILQKFRLFMTIGQNRSSGPVWDGEQANDQEALYRIRCDIEALEDRDAELLAAGRQYIQVSREHLALTGARRGGPAKNGEAFTADKDLGARAAALLARVRETRATTPAGIRMKAMIAYEYAPTPDDDGWDATDHRLSRSLMCDLLGLPTVDPSHDVRSPYLQQAGFYPTEAQAEEVIERYGGQPDAWGRAWGRYVIAKDAWENRAVKTEPDEDAAYDAFCDAVANLQEAPPHSIFDVVSTLRAAIEFNMLPYSWSEIEDERTLTDLLSGDNHEHALAAAYISALRLSGRQPAPETSAERYFPRFDHDGEPEERRAAWEAYHEARLNRPGRVAQ